MLYLDVSLVEDFVAGEEFESIREEIEQLRADGVAARIDVEHDFVVADISGTSAVVVDQIVNNSFYVDAETREPEHGEGAGEMFRDTFFMEKQNDGKAKLADFGIARALELTRLTGSSTMLGTPHYMAPEGTATAQSDLYALGCVMFEMLTGHPPSREETQQAVIAAHIRDARLPRNSQVRHDRWRPGCLRNRRATDRDRRGIESGPSKLASSGLLTPRAAHCPGVASSLPWVAASSS